MNLVHDLEQEVRELEIDNKMLTIESKQQKKTIKKLLRRIGDLEGRTSRLFSQEQIDFIHVYYHQFGMSQEEVAQLLNTSHQRISDVIKGYVKRGYDHVEY